MTEADIAALATRALADIKKARDKNTLNEIAIRWLGRKGELTNILRGIKDLAGDERAVIGARANKVREEIEVALEAHRRELTARAVFNIDITLPGTEPSVGHLHLVNEGIRAISRIFEEIGFEIVSREEIESDWFAFEALNTGPDAPARDEWETFFMKNDSAEGKDKYILSPHATSGTARLLSERQPPTRILNVQKTYRRQIDISHTPMFHQFDGYYVDEAVNLQHLKGVFEYFSKAFFGSERKLRYRPYHFPFTEPSFEIDIDCSVCRGQGCKICKEGWLELGGAGLLHPNVLQTAKIDPKKYTGFAFGWGVERNVLMQAGLHVPDIRILYENDVRFLEQF